MESLGVWECDGWIRRGHDGVAGLKGLMERRWYSGACGLGTTDGKVIESVYKSALHDDLSVEIVHRVIM